MDAIFMGLFFIIVAVLVFIITRLLWLWYFKIEDRVELLQEILNELKKLNDKIILTENKTVEQIEKEKIK